MTSMVEGFSIDRLPAPETPTHFDPPKPMPLSFTGTGSEFFMIWIVNIFLTIATLGIYSAWAKVRTRRYFSQNTHLAGSTFDFHGNPVAILKGRVLIAALYLASVILIQYPSTFIIGVLLILGLILLMPILLAFSIRFRMAYSSYRGIRFGFSGKISGAYQVFLLLPIAAAMINLLVPLVNHQIKKYIYGNAHYGATPFELSVKIRSFYWVYLKLVALGILIFAVFIVLGLLVALVLKGGGMSDTFLHNVLTDREAGSIVAFLSVLLLYSSFFFLIYPAYLAMIQNLIWNNVTLGENRFQSDVRVFRMMWIYFTNFLGILFTAGFFMPFARVRAFKYRIGHITMMAISPVDEFVAAESQQVASYGEAFADWYDIDISL